MQEIVRADPATRRRWVPFLGLALTLLAADFFLIRHLSPRHGATQQELEFALRSMTIHTIIVLSAPTLFASYGAARNAQLSRRIMASGQFPPPGMRVPFTTPVRRGRQAQTYAGGYACDSAVCVALTLFNLWMLFTL